MSTVKNKEIVRRFKSKHFLFPFCGLAVSFLIVFLWYPSNLWQYPIQFTDAPAHYYFIEKLVSNGFGGALHLTLEGAFYPPLFHIVAAACVKLFSVSVITGASLSWLFFNAIIFPLGMTFLVSYFIGQKNVFILTLTPVFAVSFSCFPYLLLHQGPLLAYATATSLLPFFIYFTLRFFDSLIDFFKSKSSGAKLIKQKESKSKKNKLIKSVIIYFLSVCLLAILSALAQPRIVFSYALFIFPFIISYLIKIYKINPKIARRVFCIVAGIIAIVAAFVALYVFKYLHKDMLFHPSTWFAAHISTDNYLNTILSGFSGGLLFLKANMALQIIATLISLGMIYVIYKSFKNKNWELPTVYLLFVFLFITSYIPSGAIGNILTAPWYHDENRIITLAPIIMIPLLTSFLTSDYFLTDNCFITGKQFSIKIVKGIQTTIIAALLVVALIIVYLILDPTRGYLADDTNKAANIKTVSNNSILTSEKLDAFEKMNKYIGKDDIVFGDPFTGLQYYYIYYGRTVYYSYINPRIDKVKQEAEVLLSFGTPPSVLHPETQTPASSDMMLKTLCAVKGEKKFFIDFGLPYRT
ncbi:MAG: hypothetical protein LBB10_02460, partial [Bifidobacteriaceae bacterium]|nr:hypothetical protein [Bifidobacteriaceae bacterium]